MIFLEDISKKWHETFVLNIHDHHRCRFFPVSKTKIFLVHFFLFMNIANISLFGTSFCALPTAKMIQKMFLCSIIIDWMKWYHGFKRKRKHLRAYINQSLLKVSPKKLKKVGRVQVHSHCSRPRFDSGLDNTCGMSLFILFSPPKGFSLQILVLSHQITTFNLIWLDLVVSPINIAFRR